MFDAQTDFEQLADGLETVTLLTPRSASLTITGALRRGTRTTEPVASKGHAAQHDCTWHLPVSQLTTRPVLGARLRDAAGNEWTILTVEAETLSARWRCGTRNLTLAYDLNDRVQIESPRYQFDKHGSATTSWQVADALLPARVQPSLRQPERVDGASQDAALFLIFIANWPANSAQPRLRDTAGRLFEVLRIEQAERLGELVQLQVRQIA